MSPVPVRVLVLGFVVLIGSCSSPPSSPPVLESIVDGDTVVIDFGGEHEVVRLLGIDTPESVDPNRPVQCFGAEAAARLAELAPVGTTVRLERDVEARDRYGRLLAYLYVDHVFVNEALLAEGFAELAIYEPNTSQQATLVRAETRARTAVTGLWAACGGADVPVDPPPIVVSRPPLTMPPTMAPPRRPA